MAIATESVLQRLFDVRDARVVVTGAASGVGLAFAEVLADCGSAGDAHRRRRRDA